MSDAYIKLQEFRRHKEESTHFFEWENVYKTEPKEFLMKEFIKQEEANYPWSKGSPQDRQRLAALAAEIRERTHEIPWFQKAIRLAKATAVASFVTIFDKFT